MNPDDFKFTKSQKNALVGAWNTSKGKQRAEEYLESVEYIVGGYVYPWNPSSMSRSESIEYKQTILKHAKTLRGMLLALKGSERLGLEASFSATAKEWEVPIAPHFDFIDSFNRRLQLVEAVCEVQLKDNMKWRKTGPQNGREYGMLVSLAISYNHCFDKKPSPSPNGNFMSFCRELSEIIKKPLGSDLAKQAINDYL